MTRLSTLLEDLRGFVLDERRVVTYRWLAITLSISFDAAKRLLYTFTQETKEQGKWFKGDLTVFLVWSFVVIAGLYTNRERRV